ncbi:DUF3383 family protein [Leptospira santarosai]|uniref:DUF3383 family protein n=1 Tax=Leptospira santarosai TaxID=28183 RepID=UPI0007741FBD|nr:DUF3383 family protein [Leptospira santarosai]MDI7195474.1 DUF3383 family protein [Leptospira santarosai]MDI7203599.1 DUF3383 family protein [Leptospira santarosai]
MSEINNINISIALSTLPLAQKGFGLVMIAGDTIRQVKYELSVLSGTSGLKWRAASPGEKFIQIRYVVNGNNTPLSVTRTGSGTSSSPHVITVAVGTNASGLPISTAAQIKTAAEAVSNVAGASKIVDVLLIQAPGDGVVSEFLQAPLIDKNGSFVEVTDADQLLDPSIGYQANDPEYKMAGQVFAGETRAEKVVVFKISSFSNLVADIAALRNSGKDDWYWLLITSRVKADIQAAAAYIDTLEKCGMFATSDQTTADEFKPERSALIVSNFANEFPDARVLGECATQEIGSVTWDSKRLGNQKNSGVTMAEQTALLAKKVNLIREMGGVNVFWEGTMMGGQYIDIINGRDLTKARLTESWHSLKINNKKLPMTIGGLRMIEASLREVFRDLGRKGVIAKVEDPDGRNKSDMGDFQYKLFLPESMSEIPTNDRANRKVSPITFTCTVGGGINKLDIRGTMGV